ncbi:MAG: type I 3-dehydroquinate dehydratase [Planctomycetes bacterium]|nr:type I 3-dehydroquinate dehydratase [Planctomycetota bacterium]MCB9918472.1 type I 3-dehydroquinate dehydratase [Planctomycetota bacterium]
MTVDAVRLVASIMPTSVDHGIAVARRARMRGADCIEYRLDRWSDPGTVSTLLRGTPGPTIVACRVPSDGGVFEGDPDERRRLLQAAVVGGVTWIDLEHWEPYCPPPDADVRVLRSFHRFGTAPRDLMGIVDRMSASDPDALKVVLRAYDAADLDLLDALYARGYEVPLVAFLAGEPGIASRFLAVLRGAPFLYCHTAADAATAPGQPDLFEALEIYRVRSMRQRVRFWGLAGSPVSHSLGTRLHNHVERHLAGAPTYLPFDSKDPERLLRVLTSFGNRFAGLSITAPLKQHFVPLCDELSPAARACGAINTLIHDSGRLRGENTDVVGIRAALCEALPRRGAFAGRRALVLGSGGSARAAVVALEDLGCEVALSVRSRQGIRAFAEEHEVSLYPVGPKVFEAFDPDVLVHATPVGQGDGRGSRGDCLVDARSLHASMVVLDLVYAPVRTPLFCHAVAAGATAVSGLTMFLHQAREQLRLVLDERPPAIPALHRLLGPLSHEPLVIRSSEHG